jgi:chitodextrinase
MKVRFSSSRAVSTIVSILFLIGSFQIQITPVKAATITLTNGGNRNVVAGLSTTNTINATVSGVTATTYIQDAFTGSNNSNLSAHAPNIGGTWGNDQGTNVFKIFNNQVRSSQSFGDSRTSNSTVPASANYEVSMDVIWVGNTSANRVGIVGRGAGVQFRGEGYEALYDAGNNRWQLGKYTGFNFTSLGTFAQTYVSGQTHNMKLAMNGTTISLAVDGVTRISVTDSSVAAAGNTGLHYYVNGNDTNSISGDNYLVSSVGGGAITANFSASGLPSGATASFSPTSCTLNCSTTITINTSSTTPTGTYPITVTGTAGPDSGSTTFNLTVNPDTTAPTSSITSPANGSTVTDSISVSATATDDVAVAGVQFKLDGVNLGSEDTTSPYSISWNTTGTTNGSHTLTALTRDTFNNSSTATGVSVTVNNPVPDTQAPTVPTNLGTSGTTETTIGLTWSSSTDNVGVTGYKIYRNGVQIGTSNNTTYQDTGLTPNTSYLYSVSAYDAAGNNSAQTNQIAIATLNDTTPPTVSISSPSSGATLSGTTTITALASDNISVVGVQFKLDGNNLGTEDTSAPYSITWDTTQATPGSHTLTAVSRDARGNTTASASINVSVVTGPYSLNNEGGKSLTQGSSVTNTITATRNGTGQSGNIYIWDTFTGSNGTNLVSHTPDVGSAWTEEQGTNVLKLLNNQLQTTQTFGESRVSSATTPATANYEVSIDVIFNGSTSANKLGIQGRSAGPQNRADGYMAVYNAAANQWELDKYSGFNLSTLGTYAQAYVAGQAHNMKLGMNGSTITVYVDGVSRISATDASFNTVGKTGIYFNINGTDTTSLLGDNYQVSDNGAIPTMSFTVFGLPTNTSSSFSSSSCQLDCSTVLTINTQSSTPAGTYPITVTGTVGSTTTTTSFNLTVNAPVADTTPPTIPTDVTAISSSPTDVTVSWTASTDNIGVAGYRVYRNSVQIGTTPNTTYSETGLFQATSYSYAVSAYDAAGNESGISSSVIATTQSDTTPPTVSITSPTNNSTVSGITTPITANVSDNVGVAGVQFKLDGNNLGAEDTVSPYSVTWNTTTASDGSHTLTATARDTAGNSTVSTQVSVTVNNSTPQAPVLYPTNLTQSPITPALVQRWQSIAATGTGLRPQVYMKVGDSNSTDFMRCFDGWENGTGPVTFDRPWLIKLDGRNYLIPTIQYFRSVTADGTNSPNLRQSAAVVVGSGSPSPLQGSNPTLIQEYNTTLPQYAIIMFGSNDIQGTLPTNITNYETGLRGIVDALIQRGVIPILTTMPERQDNAAYPLLVPAFNGVVRAIAQGRQIPLIDVNRELWPATNHGLSSDNVHLSPNGSFANCEFVASNGDLNYGVAVRNLASIEALHRVKSVLTDGLAAPDPGSPVLTGTGTPASPFEISTTSFGDMHDTRISTTSQFNNYSCTGSAATPGPEYIYRLNIAQATPLRAVVLDAGANAVNVNLLSSLNANSCIKSASRIIETTLNPGTYYITVDSLGAGAEYTLSITPCVAGDSVCGSDSTPPTVSLTSPTGGATVTSTVSVTASATDNVNVAGVQFKLDGANLGAEDASSPYSISWDTTTAANGTHTLTATARDGSGNNTTSSTLTVNVSNTTSPPPPPPSGGALVSDSFTGANATVLASHTPEVGSAWVDDQAGIKILNNKIEGINFGDSRSHNSTVINSANYDVSADITVNQTGWGNKAGVRGRSGAGNLANAYEAYYNESTGSWRLDKWVGFAVTNIGSFVQSFPLGTTKNLKLSMQGSTITVYIDGIARITVTDNSISSAGSAGVYISGGIHDGMLLDNFIVTSN